MAIFCFKGTDKQVSSELGERFKFVLNHQLASLSLRKTPVIPKSLGTLRSQNMTKHQQEKEIRPLRLCHPCWWQSCTPLWADKVGSKDVQRERGRRPKPWFLKHAFWEELLKHALWEELLNRDAKDVIISLLHRQEHPQMSLPLKSHRESKITPPEQASSFWFLEVTIEKRCEV